MKFTHKISSYLPKGTMARLALLLVILIGLPAAIFIVRKAVQYVPKAAVTTVTLSTTPASATLPPNATVRVNLSAGTQLIGFTRVVLTFNPAQINLASEVTTTTRLRQNREPATDPWIVKTTMAEANSTGRVVIALGLDELDRANPPTGTFEIANFSVRSSTTQTNVSSQLAFTVSDSQIVNMTAEAQIIASTGSTFTLNPVVTNTPTATPTATPSPTRTPTPTATFTPTPTRTPTPTPTPTMTPTGTVPPVTITNTLTPTPNCWPGDANCDGNVDILDYSILFASFGKLPGQVGYDPRANLNHDSAGAVDILDYSVLFYNFGHRS